jgi:membrane-associated phospholipid phosphatase
MRSSEWIQAGFAVILAVVAWFRPLVAHRRLVISMLAAIAVAVILLSRFLANMLAPSDGAILRDWLPVVLMLVPYWQTGQFFTGPDRTIQMRLMQIDRWILSLIPARVRTLGPSLRLTMEWAYMFCYPLVPLGLAVLYVAGMRQYASTYWLIVLVPTYLCYAITPFVPALPPRSIIDKQGLYGASNKSRVLNLWILKYGSIQAISFPSAHVASALAIACVLLRYVPVAGVLFLLVSCWIAVAAVVGGYHFAIDVLLGAITALIVVIVWLGHLIPSSLLATPAIAFVATP